MHDLAQALKNTLLDDGGPTTISHLPSERERFLHRLMNAITEIESSKDALDHTPIYLRRFPFSKTKVTRLAYLRYHVENYFNEIYILSERLQVFLTIVGRLYRNDAIHSTVLAATRPLFAAVRDSLEEMVRTRGSHVHEARFNDPQLGRLSLMDLFISTGRRDLPEFVAALEPYRDMEYRRVRSEWRTRVESNNAGIVKLLDLCGDRLALVLFAGNGTDIKFPRNLRAT